MVHVATIVIRVCARPCPLRVPMNSAAAQGQSRELMTTPHGVTIEITGAAPLLMHNAHLFNPLESTIT
jgi:hypothetical protein